MQKIAFNAQWNRTVHSSQAPSDFFGGESTKVVDLPDDFIIDLPRRADAIGGPFNGFFAGGSASYTKKFPTEDGWQGKTVLLNLDGAMANARVSINGNNIAMHPYGYTPFVVDLTPWLRHNGKANTLQISTQSWQPSSRWYAGGGIYRQVTLWVGGEWYLDPRDVFLTTPVAEADRAVVHAAVTATNTGSAARRAALTLRIVDAGGQEVGSGVAQIELAPGRTGAQVQVEVEQPRRWDDLDPYLYTALVELAAEGSEADLYTCNVGIRKIEIDTKDGMRVNGRSLKLRGGCIHHDNALLGARALPRAEERKIALLKAAGFNAIRTAHNPPSEALLDACDRLGMYVIDEFTDVWRTGKMDLDYHLWFEDWWERDLTAWVLRDRNHPSIYCWSNGNEIRETSGGSNGAYWNRVLIEKTKQLDPTRCVTCGGMFINMLYPKNPAETPLLPIDEDEMSFFNDPSIADLTQQQKMQRSEELRQPLDLMSQNYAYERYPLEAQLHPDLPMQVTETMGFYAWEYWQALKENPNAIGDFLWVAFDNLGEAGVGRVTWGAERPDFRAFAGPWPWMSCFQGDLDLDGRQLPRSYYHNVIWGLDQGIHAFTTHPQHSGEPFASMGWHWYDVHKTWTFDRRWIGKPVEVQAYADCEEVEFLVNGKTAARLKPEKMIASATLPYEPGVLEVRAYRGGAVAAVEKIHTTGAPAQIVLTPDRQSISANGDDLCYVRVHVADQAGNVVVTSDVQLSAFVSGAGKLEGFGSGNPCTTESYGTGMRFVYDGYALICLRAGFEPGEIALTVAANGLPAAQLNITVQ